MRLFLALDPPAEVVADLDRALGPLRKAHPELRWATADRWHLTLAFYGEVPDEDVERLQWRIAGKVAGCPALDLRFAGAGRFGGHVLWVGVQGDRRPLGELAKRVAVDERPFRPHLTVARAREGRTPEGRRIRGEADLRPLVAELEGYAGPGWRADAVRLIRSRLGPNPTYEDVAVWPLAGPA